jgi:antirestriction protein ArdC
MKPEVKDSLYREVTERLIEQMEAGVVVWQKPWVVSKANQPQNGASGRLYNGFNRIYLGFLQDDMGSSDPRWFTFNNVKSLGARVVKDSKSTVVVYNAPAKFEKEREDGSVESVSFWKTIYYRVFHASQVEGLEPFVRDDVVPDQPDAGSAGAAISFLDEWCHDNLRAYEYGGDRAFYQQDMDLLKMPMPDMFKRESWYAQTLAHEVVHASGHADRLNRLERAGFGSSVYAKEELVAEFGSAMLCGGLGCDADLEQSAAYLKGWADRCREEPGLLISAANQAERAVNYILGDDDGLG